MKLFIKTIFLLLGSWVILLFPTIVNAQQSTFTCDWLPGVVDGQDCIVHSESDPECDYSPGSPNQSYCASFTDEDSCIFATPSRCQDCLAPYQCFPNSCPTGYDSASFSCAGSTTNVCCLESAITPPPATVCWECVTGATNTCYERQPNQNGTCDPYWSSEGECAAECDNFQFTSYTCNRNNRQGGYPSCDPAANGEYTGDTAYTDCQQECLTGSAEPPFVFCDRGGNPTNHAEDVDGNPNPIYTALGCLDVYNFTATSSFLTKLGLGIGGGLSLLLMGIAGILISTSAGNPQRLQAGQELLTAAIAGLMLVIFSAFILRVLGVEVLGIPNLAT